MSKFLITGTGRCGTAWASSVLKSGGIKCGHQYVFRHHNVLSGEWSWFDQDGDSSFEAVPLLPDIMSKSSPILIHLYRNPIAVSKSWLECGLFLDDMGIEYYEFNSVLKKYFPVVLNMNSPDNRALMFWLVWNHYIMFFDPITIEITKVTPEILFMLVGQPDMCPQPGSIEMDFNRRNFLKSNTLDFDDLEFDSKLMNRAEGLYTSMKNNSVEINNVYTH